MDKIRQEIYANLFPEKLNLNRFSKEMSTSPQQYVRIVSELNACEECQKHSGKLVRTADGIVGKTLPPFHPNCKCKSEPEFISPVNEKKDTINHLLSQKPIPNNWSIDDWIFFDPVTGQRLNSADKTTFTSDEVAVREASWGKTIISSPRMAKDPSLDQLDIVDRVARIIFHEDQDPVGQRAMAYMLFNRTQIDGFTDGGEKTLYNVIRAHGGFEIFADPFVSGEKYWDFYNDASANPMKYIKDQTNMGASEVKDNWEYAVELSKYLVSITGSNLSEEEKRRKMLEYIENPFVDSFHGNIVNPFGIVWELSTDDVQFTWIPTKSQSRNKFNYLYKDA